MNQPLIVAATKEEMAALPADVPLLITGIGTLAAAISLTEALANGPRPSRIINAGTAGALVDGHHGVYEISHVHKHDFDHATLERITRQHFTNGIDLAPVTNLPKARLATGDAFIQDEQTRTRLAHKAQLCDMEGYACALVAQHFGIPITLIKQVSDSANEQSADIWGDAVDHGAQELATLLEKIARA
ncbi:nucleosidase [Corynebacterium sp. sy039]|uniref:nucleosidase n=1 Tax=Corynebacterium sp. sy039 TaxID=2599641 RepID=UPI0011B4A4B3|nr:nucleosidase [Corynebacterium sp. sy039]QDZ43340.1 nucleosidase [Corynebacterium sp. sy039]